MTEEYQESASSPVETPEAVEATQTIETQVNVAQGQTEAPQVVVSKPGDLIVKASTGSLKSLLTTIATFLAMIPAGVYGLMGQHKELTVWAMIVLGAVAIVYIIRQIILDLFRMWTASRPDKYSTK